MNIEITLEELNDSYDWGEVFGEGTGGNCTPEVTSLDGTDTSPVLRAEVVEIVAAVNGERDESDWVGVFKMRDGRWLCASGGCDYTGWDCQAGNTLTVACSLESLIETGITPEWCRQLGIKHPSDNE